MMFWNILIMILLFYSCVIVPVQVAFYDPDPSNEINLDKIASLSADALFFIDIFVNFLSAYEIPGTNILETRPSVLAKDYLLSWFAIDLVACIPVELF